MFILGLLVGALVGIIIGAYYSQPVKDLLVKLKDKIKGWFKKKED